MVYRIAFVIFALQTFPASGRAVPVSSARSLAELTDKADVIVKATVLSSTETYLPSAGKGGKSHVVVTTLEAVSVLKGHLGERRFEFKQSGSAAGFVDMWSPIFRFKPGACYILFAKMTASKELRRVFEMPSIKEDEGQILAADDRAVPAGLPVKDVIWEELTRQLSGGQPERVVYAIRQLHLMSGKPGVLVSLDDFPRAAVVQKLAPFLAASDEGIVSAAVEAVGFRSPYLNEAAASGWLATIGAGKLIPLGQAKYPDGWDNFDVRGLEPQMVAVADGKMSAAIRARAIRALGLSKSATLLIPLRRWSIDPEPLVRAAAALLWSDYPGLEAQKHLVRLADDKALSVRHAVAASIGFSQAAPLIETLGMLLGDADSGVRTMAAASAVSFDVRVIGDLLRSFSRNPEYRASFINALSLADANPYLDDLAGTIVAKEFPTLEFVSQMPAFTSWEILRANLGRRTAGELESGRFDRHLAALETPPNIGSYPFLEVYRFYLEKRMPARAANFRRTAKKSLRGFHVDQGFSAVDDAVRFEEAVRESALAKARQDAKRFLEADEWALAQRSYQSILDEYPGNPEAVAALEEIPRLEAAYPCKHLFARRSGTHPPSVRMRTMSCERRVRVAHVPDAPVEMRGRAGAGAKLTVRFDVLPDGNVDKSSVVVRASSGHGWLESFAVKTVGAWRWAPADSAKGVTSAVAQFEARGEGD